MLQKNTEFVVEIVDMNLQGYGVAKVDQIVVFVQGGITGERCRVRVIKTCKRYAIAKIMEILLVAPERHSDQWRGITPLGHLQYHRQLQLKAQHVQELVDCLGEGLLIEEIVPSPKVVGYRNKGQIPVRTVGGVLSTGFFPQQSHRLVPIEDFIIQDPYLDEVIIKVRNLLREYQVEAYDEDRHQGLIRHIVVRRSRVCQEVQVVLVSRDAQIPHLAEISLAIGALPEVVSVVLNLNPQVTNVILGSEERVLFGREYIVDQLLGLTFRIAAQSFYQVNSWQTATLYQLAYQGADLQATDIVLDAYSGIGTIGLPIAKKVKWVYGMEIVQDSITMAQQNISINNINNATYVVGDAEMVLRKWSSIKFDVIFVDPPRKGLSSRFIDISSKIAPRKIVYISCSPQTLVRDLQEYQKYGYQVLRVTPVDMFPQTSHVECVAVLTKLGVDRNIR